MTRPWPDREDLPEQELPEVSAGAEQVVSVQYAVSDDGPDGDALRKPRLPKPSSDGPGRSAEP